MGLTNLKIKRFLEFLYDPDTESLAEVEKDLESYGINYKRVQKTVQVLVEALGQRQKHEWLEDSQKKQDLFDRLLKERAGDIKIRERKKKSSDISLEETSFDDTLSVGISSGSPRSAQEKFMLPKNFLTPRPAASVFFRGLDEKVHSAADWESIKLDLELLDELEQSGIVKPSKKGKV